MPIITPATRAAWSFPADATLSLLDVQELDRNCGYSWTVETRFTSNSRGANQISVNFVGSRKGRKSYAYRPALSAAQNHIAAAVEWLQQLSSLNGAPAYALVAKASTERGYVLTFC
jgi:hypothetical protein